MLRIRMVEEEIARRYPEQEMRCPVHLSIGQEGVAVGVCSALEERDYALSAHRAHAHYLAKGGGLKAMLAEMYGRRTGCAGGKGGSMHLVDPAANMLGAVPIVGGSIPIAVGAAFASWMKGEDRVTAVFLGDGATEEGVFAESLNFAALKSLPVLFICENNLYSVYSPLSVRQAPGRDRLALARAHGMEAREADGNDVEAVYRLTLEAAGRARRGEGPAYLEFSTYRWLEHCGPNYDNDAGYRSEEEFASWRAQCPVLRQQALLESGGLLAAEHLAALKRELASEIEEAFAFAKASPYPAPSELMTDVYADGPRD
jgi:pyruvate dehydrogenase E1 component alpha subunit